MNKSFKKKKKKKKKREKKKSNMKVKKIIRFSLFYIVERNKLY